MIFKHAKLLLLAAIALSALASLFSGRINSYWLIISYEIGINIILAVSLNLINGYTGQFSLGHAGFMAVGGYTAAVITNHFTGGNPFLSYVIFLGALLAGGLLAAVTGLLVGLPTLRLRGDYLAIVTLGFGEIIRVILQNMDERHGLQLGGARGLSVAHGWTNFFWAFGFAAVTIYVVTALVHSTYGRGFIAVRDDEVAAEAMGVNTTKYKVAAFVIGAFFAGIGGGLYAHAIQFLTPNGFGFMASISFVVMVILGGMGNTPGVIVAAILLTLLPEGLRLAAGIEHLPGINQDHPLSWVGNARMVIYSLLLVVLMLTRPQGLFTFRKSIYAK
jgi:branched-chain amino acid transport system permease protein